METPERRAVPRRKVLIHAFASNSDETISLKCVIRDVSPNGCSIVTSEMEDLPDRIYLTPANFERPLCGRIIWRDGKTAGVRFTADSMNVAAGSLRTLASQTSAEDVAWQDSGEGAADGASAPQVAATPLSFFSRMQVFFSRFRARLSFR